MKNLYLILCVFLFCFNLPVNAQTLKNQRKSTEQLSKQNQKNSEKKKEDSPGPNEISKKNPNYKDVDRLANKCVAMKSNGKRCNSRVVKGTSYCKKHSGNNYGY